MNSSQLDAEEIKEYYNGLKEIWASDDFWHLYSKSKIEYYLSKHKFPNNSYILNAGSGGNNYGLECKQHHVDIADKKISHLNQFTIASIENLPFDNNYFDGVICVGSVINYCDAVQAISELHRVLKKGSILILEFENSYGYEYKAKPTYKKAADVTQVIFQNEVHSQWLYSHLYVKNILKQYKFKIKNEYSFHILSSYILYKGLSEEKAVKFAYFDRILQKIPLIRKHGNNILLVCEKL